MKFCRNLQRVIEITDSEWAPYWVNYKMLKKFLKNLPSFVPPDGEHAGGAGSTKVASSSAFQATSPDSSDGEGDATITGGRIFTSKKMKGGSADVEQESKAETAVAAADMSAKNNSNIDSHNPRLTAAAANLARNPGEVAFFRLLNSELRKAIHFFEKAQLEFEIREARVRDGIDIMRKANSLMVSEKWSLMAKSLYRLYKDLLLLETFAIMTYCSFSKILKKHDKVTSHNTRIAFMKNVVNKANFTHYPKLLTMIGRCESLYDEVSQSLIQEGKSGLYEDERLFINMIQRLNEQVLDTAQEEGANVDARKERRQNGSPSIQGGTSPLADSHPEGESSLSFSSQSSGSPHSPSQVNTLRHLVEENSINKSSKEGLARVQEQKSLAENTLRAAEALAGLTAATSAYDSNKRTLTAMSPGEPIKRARTE